jgi:signal transduction histidine kinase
VPYGQFVSSDRLASRRAPRPVDVLLGVVFGIIVTGSTTAAQRWHGAATGHPLDALGYGLLWAACLTMLIRRRLPMVAFLLSAGLVSGYYFAGYPGGPAVIVPVFALAMLAFRRGPVVAGVASGAVDAVVIAGILVRGDSAGVLDARLFGLVLGTLAAVAMGTAGRLRRAAAAEGRARLVERERRRSEQERLRIAREVHDVVAHSLAMINVQAGVAAHVADRRPEQAKAALLAIKEASRSALTDLRATLDVLRSGEERTPTPGMSRLPDLIATAGSAGLAVTVHGAEETAGLAAPVDVAAYRILQESLTNVVRHAAGADTVTVRLLRTGGQLEISVLDNGEPTAAPAGTSAGNGLRGMAERAAALGGGVSAGPAAGGGFEVRARLPLAGGDDR